MNKTDLPKLSLCLTLTLLLLMCGCSKQYGPVKRSWGKMKGLEKTVGNMKNNSYSTGRSQKPRINALGKPVSMVDFEGGYVWAEYAAPWCKTCAWQTPVTQKVAAERGDSVTFITVMTSQSQRYDDHATVKTAQGWARRFRLNNERVVAAELWYKTIPEHRFYSPEGHTLFVHVGALNGKQINDVIDYYSTGWDAWKTSGRKAEWMK